MTKQQDTKYSCDVKHLCIERRIMSKLQLNEVEKKKSQKKEVETDQTEEEPDHFEWKQNESESEPKSFDGLLSGAGVLSNNATNQGVHSGA